MIKTHNTVGMEGNFLDMIKAIYEKPTCDIILSGENTESFFPKVRKKTRMPAFTVFIQHSTRTFLQNN